MLWIRRALVAASAATAFVLVLRFFPGPRPRGPARLELIAHRGVHHTFPSDVTMTECTALRIHAVTHGFIENTIPSMQAAFDHGATMVEIDVHPTVDDAMVVFHDWTVDCRTEGRGVTHEQTLAYLKTLDVGYGYSADGGRSFPLRGRGVGMMPTLQEVLDRFPERGFVINQKDRDRRTLEILARVLAPYPSERRGRLGYWGLLPEAARELIPDLGRCFNDRGAMKGCAQAYLLSLGLGALPGECRGGEVSLPVRATPWIWGWPNRFLAKSREAGTGV